MLDVLFLPAAALLGLALLAARRGDFRLHGQLAALAATVVFLRVSLYARDLTALHRALWLALLAAATGTLALGSLALAWREARSPRAWAPRTHRAAGALTLALAAVTIILWLLRDRR
ncbi:hypothetical protein [Geothrix sp. 21YS21S-4]|uniref:hypothetical protein n=1 Tax=Geothrix sp. 21YS21S-4 TaxID=3068889 RepID=UPI0027B9BED7|nr:hypothetical protein [Geothrix sp. 21YS21S-4]